MSNQPTFWFLTGSQHLYGPETLEQVLKNSTEIIEHLNRSEFIPFTVLNKGVVTTSDSIRQVILEANADPSCAGVITWMHTFSPAKMWIAGLAALQKPLLHLHTQYNRDIPWNSIDMDFMNLNQSAHGDREYGFIGARMKVARKVITGHWRDQNVQTRVGAWMRTAAGFMESHNLKVARFGDNMRQVAVTEGDKVEAQIAFGWSVNGYGVGDLVQTINAISDGEVNQLLGAYSESYEISSCITSDSHKWAAVKGQARIELGLRRFLDEVGAKAFTTTFEDLHGIEQLPGLAVQSLMKSGYGFGGEGDWKTAALVRIMKVMAGYEGTSFMEDYTYHLDPENELVLGAHMLEICPTIAATRPEIRVHPLSIGGKADPARLVFDGKSGPAVCATIVDLGRRFRLIVNEVDAVQPTEEMPNLPVARVLWKPQPSLSGAAESWIYAGGAHHTVLSYNVTAEQLVDLAEMMGIECVLINKDTSLVSFRNELRIGDIAWSLK